MVYKYIHMGTNIYIIHPKSKEYFYTPLQEQTCRYHLASSWAACKSPWLKQVKQISPHSKNLCCVVKFVLPAIFENIDSNRKFGQYCEICTVILFLCTKCSTYWDLFANQTSLWGGRMSYNSWPPVRKS